MSTPDAGLTTADGAARAHSRGMLERHEDPDGFLGYRSPLLASLGIPHVFTTRRLAHGRELDLVHPDPAVRARVGRAAGLESAPLVAVKQVHGAHVLLLRAGELPPPVAEADGLVSERPDALVGVHTADCVPVLLARRDGRRVAAVHAGWRGVVAGVVPRALEMLGDGPLAAAIGPCLSRRHFEVGPEVTAAFTHVGLAASILPGAPGTRDHIDLVTAVELQLHAGGVRLIDASGVCTYADEAEFYSYRRDVTHGGRGRTGRLGAWIAAHPERRARG